MTMQRFSGFISEANLFQMGDSVFKLPRELYAQPGCQNSAQGSVWTFLKESAERPVPWEELPRDCLRHPRSSVTDVGAGGSWS